MTTLQNEFVKTLIASAVKAGNKKPSFDQLITLATAVGNNDALTFLKTASFKEKVAVKNCIAAVSAAYVFGKEPTTIVSKEGATAFGMTLKEKEVADNKNENGKPEKSERISDEDKDIKKRRTTEEYHPETSDRKTKKPAVAAPLKMNIDDKFKAILDRGPKWQEKLEKGDDRKPLEGEKSAEKTATKTADKEHGKVTDLNQMHDNNPSGDFELDNLGVEDKIHEEQERKIVGSIAHYASRIKRGENVEKVLSELISVKSFKHTFADVNEGDTVTVQTNNGAQNVKIDNKAKDISGNDVLVGTDSTNQKVTIPAGTQVSTVADPNGVGATTPAAPAASTTPSAAPATPII